MPSSARPHLALHSFPTRRSSDLRGADLFESTAAENIGAMILAATLAKSFGSAISAEVVIGVMLFPLVARAFGILASILGLFATKIREDQDPMTGLNRGYYLTSVLAAVGFFVATYWLLKPFAAQAGYADAWIKYFFC